jgi:hypothetical protein
MSLSFSSTFNYLIRLPILLPKTAIAVFIYCFTNIVLWCLISSPHGTSGHPDPLGWIPALFFLGLIGFNTIVFMTAFCIILIIDIDALGRQSSLSEVNWIFLIFVWLLLITTATPTVIAFGKIMSGSFLN